MGKSFSCDGSTERAVVWDKGAIINLNVPIPEPININDKGQLAGDGLPPGCDDENICGHEFLLIPCAAGQGCEGTDDGTPRTNPASISTRATTQTQRHHTTKEFVAQWRARLSQRYHIHGVRASPRD